jgi:hypothetical protein
VVDYVKFLSIFERISEGWVRGAWNVKVWKEIVGKIRRRSIKK